MSTVEWFVRLLDAGWAWALLMDMLPWSLS